ncbi:MAG: hypothetical protein LLF89_04215, partial [Spirochaetaceae bacterium]|nr:hypothetical protein [Spirochaetaceae bacterium]
MAFQGKGHLDDIVIVDPFAQVAKTPLLSFRGWLPYAPIVCLGFQGFDAGAKLANRFADYIRKRGMIEVGRIARMVWMKSFHYLS